MLQGTIADFRLTDIFRLITLTEKSGALTVSNTQTEGRIVFRDGEICFAVADVARVAIGARLVRAGLASEEQVFEILERKRREGASGNLSQALLEAVGAEGEALDAFVRSSIEDAVFELMRLTEARFTFDGSEDADTTLRVTVSTEHLIAEGDRRTGEWASIREHIPTSDAVLAVSPAAAQHGKVSITDEQWRVIALIDGARTVREIVDLAAHAEFTTAQLLAAMVTQGLIEVAGTDGPGALRTMFTRRDQLRRIEALELGQQPARVPASPPSDPMPADDDVPASAVPQQPLPQQQPRTLAVSMPVVPADPDEAEAPVGRSLEAQVDRSATEVVAAVPEPNGPRELAASEESGVATLTLARPLADRSAPQTARASDDAMVPPVPASSVEVAEVIADLDEGDIIGHDGARSPAGAPGGEHTHAGPNGNGNGNGGSDARGPHVDRAQVARELASLGLGGSPEAAAAPPAANKIVAPPGAAKAEARRLTRDEDVNRGLLLRLIDGVKGA